MATMREFLNAIVTGTLTVKTPNGDTSAPTLVTAEDGTVSISAEVVALAKAEIVKIDAKNAKRQAKPSKTQEQNAVIKSAIVDGMKPNGVYLASDIAKAHDISTQKVSALMKQLSADGLVTIMDTKVKGKGTLKAYKLADSAEDGAEPSADGAKVAEDVAEDGAEN